MKRFTTGKIYYGHDVIQRIYSQKPSRWWRFQHWLMERTDAKGFWLTLTIAVIAAIAFGAVVNL